MSFRTPNREKNERLSEKCSTPPPVHSPRTPPASIKKKTGIIPPTPATPASSKSKARSRSIDSKLLSYLKVATKQKRKKILARKQGGESPNCQEKGGPKKPAENSTDECDTACCWTESCTCENSVQISRESSPPCVATPRRSARRSSLDRVRRDVCVAGVSPFKRGLALAREERCAEGNCRLNTGYAQPWTLAGYIHYLNKREGNSAPAAGPECPECGDLVARYFWSDRCK